MIDVIDCEHVYKGYGGRLSKCRVRLYRVVGEASKYVLIATELPDNPGTSVTNCNQKIAANVCTLHGIDPDDLVFIEHYPARRKVPVFGHEAEHLSVVIFAEPDCNQRHRGMLGRPSWAPIERYEVERMIHRHLD